MIGAMHVRTPLRDCEIDAAAAGRSTCCRLFRTDFFLPNSNRLYVAVPDRGPQAA
jgi:hypothetical protein